MAINPQHIYQFCDAMKSQYGAGFTQHPTHTGFKVVGEYLAFSGQVISIMLDVYRNKVDIKFFDGARRLIFNDSTAGNINNVSTIGAFLQKSVNTY